MPEARALGKRAVSPVSSAVAAEPGGGGGDATGPAEDRRGTRVRRGPTGAGGYGCDATAAASAVAEEVCCGEAGAASFKAQAAIQRGAASARVDPQEPAAQGRVAEAAPTRSDGAIVPFVAEAPGTPGTEAMGAPTPMAAETAVSAAGASASGEAMMTEAGAPETAEAVTAEAGAPEVTTAVVMAARPSVQEA
ncbi:predicted GPI-anchored protein 23 [Miscanthus floridulus]|uniref:predicted GPI-anchored protein 23 n=1 Tax=Miscanthus floridulus TaxID=154761 RepID=UPI0034583B32